MGDPKRQILVDIYSRVFVLQVCVNATNWRIRKQLKPGSLFFPQLTESPKYSSYVNNNFVIQYRAMTIIRLESWRRPDLWVHLLLCMA